MADENNVKITYEECNETVEEEETVETAEGEETAEVGEEEHAETDEEKLVDMAGTELSDKLVMLIPAVPMISMVFQKWCVLNPQGRTYVKNDILQFCEGETANLATSLCKALDEWKEIQENDGAPGYPAKPEGYKELVEDLSPILTLMEYDLNKIAEDSKLKTMYFEEAELAPKKNIFPAGFFSM